MKTGFIYLWYDRKHKRYYVGSHLGDEDDGYICSSTWMKSSYKRRPEDFKRRILRRDIEKNYLKEQEYEWLKQIKPEELGKRYYNLNNKKILKPGNWPEGKSRSEETKKKLSEAAKKQWEEGNVNSSECFKKGSVPWNKGKKGVYSEETKNKIRQAALNQKNRKTNKGFRHTDEWKRANSERLKEQWASGVRKGGIPAWNKGKKINE